MLKSADSLAELPYYFSEKTTENSPRAQKREETDVETSSELIP
jgi:hypothetical protein